MSPLSLISPGPGSIATLTTTCAKRCRPCDSPPNRTSSSHMLCPSLDTWRLKRRLATCSSCCVKHAHVSRTLLASLYVYRLDSLLVLYISTYVLHLYKQRSNKTYSCSRLIKLAQATRAQKSASSNMAAQALCEPAPNNATKSIANFKTGFYRLFRLV
jgi:hypothetical protein